MSRWAEEIGCNSCFRVLFVVVLVDFLPRRSLQSSWNIWGMADGHRLGSLVVTSSHGIGVRNRDNLDPWSLSREELVVRFVNEFLRLVVSLLLFYIECVTFCSCLEQFLDEFNFRRIRYWSSGFTEWDAVCESAQQRLNAREGPSGDQLLLLVKQKERTSGEAVRGE